MTLYLIDIGGVLLELNFSRALERLSLETGIEPARLAEEIFSNRLKEKHDAGQISSIEFYHSICPNEKPSFETFKTIWCDIFEEKTEVVRYILSVHNTDQLYLASNTDPLHFEWFHRRFEWMSAFDSTGLSFRLRAIKPSPKFFTRLLRLLGVREAEVLFVDNLACNVEAASALGIKSHQFTNLMGLKNFMSTYKVE